MKKERMALYDNTKLLLMVLVVLGHFMEPLTESDRVIKYTFLVIYSFHMPLFIFISGLMQKKYEGDTRLNVNRVISFIMVGYLYKILNFFRGYLVEKPTKFHMFWEDGIPWFMFTLALIMVLMYVCRDIKPVYLLGFSIILACFAGYDSKIGDTLCLSRTIVYFPFYALGYYLDPKEFVQFTRKKNVRIGAILAGVAILVAFAMRLDTAYQLRHLFTGRNPFNAWDKEHFAWMMRALTYVLTTVVGFAFVCLVPNRTIPVITAKGKDTMRIYFWHLFIINYMMFGGYGEWVLSMGVLRYPILILSAIALSWLCTLKAFSIPTDYILNRSYIINKKK